jgi:hypothetical protein
LARGANLLLIGKHFDEVWPPASRFLAGCSFMARFVRSTDPLGEDPGTNLAIGAE